MKHIKPNIFLPNTSNTINLLVNKIPENFTKIDPGNVDVYNSNHSTNKMLGMKRDRDNQLMSR